jgi:hypothetical protein
MGRQRGCVERRSNDSDAVAAKNLARNRPPGSGQRTPYPRAAGKSAVATGILLTKAKQVSDDRACAAGLRVSGHAGVGTGLRGEGQSDRVCRNGDKPRFYVKPASLFACF